MGACRALVAVRVHEVEDALILLALREAEPDEGRRDVREPQEGRLQAVQGLVQLHDEGAVWRHELLALRVGNEEEQIHDVATDVHVVLGHGQIGICVEEGQADVRVGEDPLLANSDSMNRNEVRSTVDEMRLGNRILSC